MNPALADRLADARHELREAETEHRDAVDELARAELRLASAREALRHLEAEAVRG